MWVARAKLQREAAGVLVRQKPPAKLERAAVLTRQTSFWKGPPTGRRCRPTCVTNVMASPA
jgi:hypothetical protein